MDDKRRHTARRTTDVADIAEVRLLRHEIAVLKDSLAQLKADMETEEESDHIRLGELEDKVTELKRKFSGTTGVLYGIAASLTAAGYLLLDRLKELFIK